MAELRGLSLYKEVTHEDGENIPFSHDINQVVQLRLVPSHSLAPGPLIAEIRFPPEGLMNVIWRFHLADGTDRFVDLPRVRRNQFSGLVSLPAPPLAVTLEISGSGDPLSCSRISLHPLRGLKKLLPLAQRLSRFGAREVRRFMGRRISGSLGRGAWESQAYDAWRERFDERPDLDRDLHRARAARLCKGPLFSLLLSASSDREALAVTIASLRAQFYSQWELFVLVEAGMIASVEAALGNAAVDGRITVSAVDGSGARAWNEGLSLARGEFIGILPSGARLPAHTLTEVAATIMTHPETELLYTDEDRLDAMGRRCGPRFKPDWSPDFLWSYDYLGCLTVYRTNTLQQLGGWRSLEGAEEFDAKLRLSDAVSSRPGAILHLPKVLVHLPDQATEMNSRLGPAALQALSEHAARRGLQITWSSNTGRLRARFQPPQSRPLVSIIVPTRDQAVLLRTCIRSILERTEYQAYEIIIVDNGSQEAETIHLFEELSRDERVRVLAYPHPFNYSAINNFAVRHAQGSLLALLNNDVEVVTPEWLSELVAHANRPEIGCVGAKLLYPDGTIQHGGIVLGVGGLAGHAHRTALATTSGYLNRLQCVLNVSAVTAACLVVRRDTFDEIGGFDEIGLATAFNDVDLCLKARAAGYRNLWSPYAILIHHESKSRGYERTPSKRARLAAEEDVMRRRWGRALLDDPYYSQHLTRLSEDFRVRCC